jgi:hypothetical protein
MENKETIEEAAENYSIFWLESKEQLCVKDAFEAGAKWQAERMYSEEDLEVAYFEGEEGLYSFNDWLRQFKKK